MAYDDEYDDEGNPIERVDLGQLPAPARKQLRQLEKANKAYAEELATLRQSLRTSTVESVLAAKGVNPKVAAFIPATVEASPEAVGKWIDEFGEVFNLSAQTQTQQASAPVVDPRTGETTSIPAPTNSYNTYSLDDVNAQAQMNMAQSGGTPVEVAGDLMAKILAAANPAELDALRGAPNLTSGRMGL